jgi:hypothetical protein
MRRIGAPILTNVDTSKSEGDNHRQVSLIESSTTIVESPEIVWTASKERKRTARPLDGSSRSGDHHTSIEGFLSCSSNLTNAAMKDFLPGISDISQLRSRPSTGTGNNVVIPRLRGDSSGMKNASQTLAVPVLITRELLDGLRGLPLPRAASAVGVSATAFKKACRRLGVARWDYKRGRGRRQISDHSAAIDDAEAIAQEGPEPIPCHSNSPSRHEPPAQHPATTPEERVDLEPSASDFGPRSPIFHSGSTTPPARLPAEHAPRPPPQPGSDSSSVSQWSNAVPFDPTPLRPEQSGAIGLPDSAQSESGELAAGVQAGGSLHGSVGPPAHAPAPPQPPSIELGWPDLGGETEGWADEGAGLAAADDALVLAMLARPWPDRAPCDRDTRPPSESSMGLEWPARPSTLR